MRMQFRWVALGMMAMVMTIQYSGCMEFFCTMTSIGRLREVEVGDESGFECYEPLRQPGDDNMGRTSHNSHSRLHS
jgi:hypothetical protein